jgi:uncharacterized membrane protein (DUF485 family)
MTGHNETDWAQITTNPKFVELHRRKVKFLFGWWIVSTIIYLVLLIGAGLAPKLFACRIVGDINFGYVFIISLFIYCWAVAGYYAVWANRVSDKITAELVAEFEEAGVKK